MTCPHRLAGRLAALALVCATTAAAATITVTTVDDELNTDGDCSLREAIVAANTDAGVDACTAGNGDDLVMLPAGTYELSVAGAGENAAATGDLDLAGTVAIVGAGRVSTHVVGNPGDRIFEVLANTDVQLESMTLRDASPMLNGGAIANHGTLTVTNCNIIGNVSNGSTGGAIYSYATSALTVRLSQIAGNYASSDGGAIASHGTTVLEDVSFTGNTAGGRAGAIYVASAASGSLTISNATFSGNGADEEGGAIYADNPTSITGASFDANQAGVDGDGGGAVYCGDAVTIRESAFTANTSDTGGGAIDATGSCALTLANVTLHANTAREDGGAVRATGASTTATLNNVTVTANQADTNMGGFSSGGGLHVGSGSTVTVGNSVLADNTANGVASDCAGAVTSAGHNLLRSISGCTVTLTTGDLSGVDPQLDALAANGGLTLNRVPAAGSPLRDAGDPATPGGGGTACEAVDQRGFGRPAGAACDIGADEADGVVTTSTTSTTDLSSTTTTGGTTSSTSATTTSTTTTSTTTTTTSTATTASTSTTSTTAHATTSTTVPPTPLCTGGVTLQIGTVWIGKAAVSGDRQLVVRGLLALPAGTPPRLDSGASSLQLRVEDLGAGMLLDLTVATAPIPAGGKQTGCAPRDGWTGGLYTNVSNAIDPPTCTPDSAQGLRRARLQDRRARNRGVRFTALAKRADLPPLVGPVLVTVVAGDATAGAAGLCGVGAIGADHCDARGGRSRCRGTMR